MSVGPHAAITSVASPASAYVGVSVQITLTVKNDGSIAVPIWADILDTSTLQVVGGRQQSANLAVGASTTFSWMLAMPNIAAGAGWLLRGEAAGGLANPVQSTWDFSIVSNGPQPVEYGESGGVDLVAEEYGESGGVDLTGEQYGESGGVDLTGEPYGESGGVDLCGETYGESGGVDLVGEAYGESGGVDLCGEDYGESGGVDLVAVSAAAAIPWWVWGLVALLGLGGAAAVWAWYSGRPMREIESLMKMQMAESMEEERRRREEEEKSRREEAKKE